MELTEILTSDSSSSNKTTTLKAQSTGSKQNPLLNSNGGIHSSGLVSIPSSNSKSLSSEMTCNRGTPLWMAPELVKSIKMESRGVHTLTYSQSVDVYSFGIILWEAMELKAPWSVKKYQKWTFTIFDDVEAGKRPPITNELTAPQDYVDLVKECWHHDPDSRPTFPIVKERLKQMLLKYSESKSSRRSTVISHSLFESADEADSSGEDN